jgi:hypothetical protein
VAFSPTKRKRHRGSRPKEMILQITSLVDVFTIQGSNLYLKLASGQVVMELLAY